MKYQKPGRILIMDDHPLVREGLRARISGQPDLQVCGEAATEGVALALVEQATPDLVIIGASLASGHGIELVKQIKSRHAEVKTLVVSRFHEALYVERVLRAGALGYLNKHESRDKLVEAIRAVLSGQRYVSQEMLRRLIDQALSKDLPKQTIERLTDRQLEIFWMIGAGLTSSAIANKLFLSTHTVDTHRENIKRKLGLSNGGELSRAAIQWVLEND